MARNVELNLGWEPLVRVRGAEDDTGIGDINLGVRYRFVEGFEDVPWPPHLAVKVFAKVPAAEEPLSTGRPDFGVLLLGSFELLLGFVELLFSTREERDGREQLSAQIGLVYRLTPEIAVDVGLQTSLAGQAPDYVVRSGVSVLWR